MKKVLVTAVLLLLSSSLCVVAADTLKGSISDKMCGADHHGSAADKCTASCVKNGSAYIFVDGNKKVFDISNADKVKDELAKHAGHNVEVTGTMSKDGKSVSIDKITMPAAKK